MAKEKSLNSINIACNLSVLVGDVAHTVQRYSVSSTMQPLEVWNAVIMIKYNAWYIQISCVSHQKRLVFVGEHI